MKPEADILDEVGRRASVASVIALDTETDGLDWRSNRAVGYVITTGLGKDESFYLPFGHASGPNYDKNKIINFMQSLVCMKKTFVFHYAAFDLGMFANDGIEFWDSTYLEDTLINEALLDEYAKGYSLDACCERRGIPLKPQAIYHHIKDKLGLGGEPNKSMMEHFHRLPADDALAHEYATGDGTNTLMLRTAQHIELESQSLLKIHDIESRLIKVLHNMTQQGVKVDEDQLERSLDIVERGATRAREQLPDGFNVRSNPQIAKLFRAEGIDDFPTTKIGNPSFTEDWLSTNDIGQKIVAVRKLDHMKSSFLIPMRDRHLHRGRVHCNWNQTIRDDFGTTTYRLSCNDPNMQQAHKRNSYYGVLYRSIFVPDDGLEWDSNDLVQCEPVLLAHYSGCRVLLDGFLSEPPIDAHQAVATAANIDRQSGKRLNQALITGAGKNKVIEMLGRADGYKIYEAYFEAMPEIKTFLNDAALVMKSRGHLNSLLGHRMRVESRGDEYKAVNRVLQTGNADIIKESMVRIEEEIGRGPDFAMLLNVHDSLEFQYDKSLAALKALAHAREIFTDYGPGKRTHLDAPMRIDSHSGKNWAEATWTKDVVDSEYDKWEKFND